MLEGKVALVTGASRGIGKAIAIALAKKGAMVIVNYGGSAQAARETVEEIESLGGKAQELQCDVADYEACGEMIKTVLEKYGRLDVLVNNAGITRDGLILRMSEADYDAVMSVNLKGAFNTIRHASKAFLKQRSGKIINISSVSALLGNPGQANYAASKAGLIAMSKCMAQELAGRGITLNCVAPGFIKTPMTDVLPDAAKAALMQKIPMGRLGSAADVANAVVFLASEEAAYITGQTIHVNGGMAML